MAERLLIVDDEVVNRELIEAILLGDDFDVEMAGDGPTALAQATSAPPDLILLDVLMPGMSGLEVCQRLKAEARTRDVPIIMVTAVGQMTMKEAALLSGAEDFVTKPVDAGDLRARVQAMLKVRRVREDLDRALAYLHELEIARHAIRQATLSRITGGQTRPSQDPVPGISILLVDDEALTREFYGDLLALHGFDVHAAVSGPDALALTHTCAPEAVILDIMMPGMSGLEVLERLGTDSPDLPVIILSAQATSQNAIAALKLGAFDFILKGLDHNLVVLAVHRAVRHRREILRKKSEIEGLRARIAVLDVGLRQPT